MLKQVWSVVALALVLAPSAAHAQDEVVYYHTDAIGSVRMVTDATGAVIARYDYLPFGETWPTSPPNTTPDVRQFTSKERDVRTELDYFGARYLRAQSGRFTTVDPVLNIESALVHPQRWNRYAYSLNNPITFTDPDGRDVKYANSQLQALFEQMAARSAMIRATLGAYTGTGKPDLLIVQGDAGRDLDGVTKANGSFDPKRLTFNVDYSGKEQQILPGMTVEQIENLGNWTTTGQATLTLDNSLTISFRNKTTVETAIHELGHADQAARTPLQYQRDNRNVYFPNGKLIPHDQRAVEKFASDYLARALREVWR